MSQVLVIDDSPIMVSYLKGKLESQGYEVLTAGNGQMGIEMIDTFKPTMVITDLLMPVRDGVEVVLHVRERHPGIRTIAISAGGAIPAGYHLSMVRKLGADYVMPKPIDWDRLRKTLSFFGELSVA